MLTKFRLPLYLVVERKKWAALAYINLPKARLRLILELEGSLEARAELWLSETAISTGFPAEPCSHQ